MPRQLEAGLADRLPRIAEPQALGHRRVGANETASSVFEVDRVRHAVEKAIEQVALVKERVLGRLEPADVDQSDDHSVDGALGAVWQNAQKERTVVAIA